MGNVCLTCGGINDCRESRVRRCLPAIWCQRIRAGIRWHPRRLAVCFCRRGRLSPVANAKVMLSMNPWSAFGWREGPCAGVLHRWMAQDLGECQGSGRERPGSWAVMGAGAVLVVRAQRLVMQDGILVERLPAEVVFAMGNRPRVHVGRVHVGVPACRQPASPRAAEPAVAVVQHPAIAGDRGAGRAARRVAVEADLFAPPSPGLSALRPCLRARKEASAAADCKAPFPDADWAGATA